MKESKGKDELRSEIARWNLSDEQMDYLLWEGTAYPFASAEHTARQLRDLRRLSGGDFAGALSLSALQNSVDARLYLRPQALPASIEPREG